VSKASATSASERKVGRPERVTFRETRASFNHKYGEPISVAWFVRPVADLVTPPFYNAGFSANAVTALRVYIALAGVALLMTPWAWGLIAAPILFYIVFVLDCVDGNIARLGNSATYWGKYWDGLTDFVFFMGAPFAAGIGVWVSGGPIWALVLGALTSIISLASQLARNRLSFMREWMIRLSGPLAAGVDARLAPMRRIQTSMVSAYTNGTYAAPLLLFIPERGLLYYVIALVPLQMLVEMIWLVMTVREAHIMLQRPRLSAKAVPQPAAAQDRTDEA
jgi:phosphatidylglycerophosphate synthase